MKPNNMKRFVVFAGLTAIISCGGGGGGGVSTPVNSNVGNKGSATNPSTGSNRQVDDLKGIALKDIIINNDEISVSNYDTLTGMLPEEDTKALLNKSFIYI